MSCFRAVQFFTVVLVVTALGGLVTAGVVRYWWVTANQEEGIWQTCTVHGFLNFGCNNRDDIFKFDGNLTKDILLASVAGSALLAIVAFTFALINICHRYPSKCFMWLQVFSAFFAACGAAFTIVWGMVKYDHNNIGWAFYCLFASCGLLIFSFIFSIIMLKMRKPGS